MFLDCYGNIVLKNTKPYDMTSVKLFMHTLNEPYDDSRQSRYLNFETTFSAFLLYDQVSFNARLLLLSNTMPFCKPFLLSLNTAMSSANIYMFIMISCTRIPIDSSDKNSGRSLTNNESNKGDSDSPCNKP